MNNYPELWDYFQATKTYETITSSRKIHSGLVLFNKKYRGAWFHLLLLSAVYLIQWVRLSTNTVDFKFTINYIIDIDDGSSDPLTERDIYSFQVNGRHHRLMQLTIGNSIHGEFWYDDLKRRIALMVEKYEGTSIYGLGIRLYGAESMKSTHEALPVEVMKNSVWDILKGSLRDAVGLQEVVCLRGENSSVLKKVNNEEVPVHRKGQEVLNHWDVINSGQFVSISKPDKKTKTFIVSDIETIQIDDIHVPYAMGYTFAGERDSSLFKLASPVTYCTESMYYSGSFKERSRLMFDDFLNGLISYSKSCGTKRVYFHNLSRFDGILILKLLLGDSSNWIIKPVIREHNVYQIVIYDKGRPKIPVLDIRDSLKLLPGSLRSLGETMCPELGGKGSIPHEELNEFNISERKAELIKYLEQDILILAGVLRKAQEKYWNRFNIDITNCLTVSSMAMKIYRTHYYPNTYPIYRPQPNKAAFIRRGYYGGHTDVYKPYGKGLFYYDVNSLYPYAMLKPMPGGKPVWHGNLKGCDLEQLFGFVEAKVTCPDSLKVPLLPYKDPKTGTLLFPVGTFTGVYFTEELKLALKVGYKIELNHGYLFEKKESPFSQFVREIYDERKEAKKARDQVMSYIHKLTMNSLYGRFGIKPECNITEICDRDRLDDLMSIYQFGMVEPVNGTHYVVSYTSGLQKMTDEDSEKGLKLRNWMDLRNGCSSSAVQMSAAITAYARIHMYPYISLPGSYYTDTDSVVLDKPLPDSEVSETELGKLKLECEVLEGYFLAPKCYALVLSEDGSKNVIRNKGLARDKVDLSWFIEQYKNLDRIIKCTVESSFRINWPKLNVYRTKMMLNLGIDPSTKRDLVIDSHGLWIDTKPLKIENSEVLRSSNSQVKISPMPMALDQVESANESPITEDRRDKEWATALNDKPGHQQNAAMPTVDSKPDHAESANAMLTVESKPDHAEKESDRSNVTGIDWLYSAYKKLEEDRRTEGECLLEELRIERLARSHIEEELRYERSARERLEERLKILEDSLGIESTLISDDQKWEKSAMREKQRIKENNELSAEEEAKRYEGLLQPELNALFTPEPESKPELKPEPEVIASLREITHRRQNGLASSPQDNPQDKASTKEEDSSSPDTDKGPSERKNGNKDSSSSGPTAFDPDKSMKPSERGKKDRNRSDHPSARDPP